jgi:hypothetical protein
VDGGHRSISEPRHSSAAATPEVGECEGSDLRPGADDPLHLAGLREPSHLELREHQLVVHLDIEHAATALDQVGRRIELPSQLGRQPGGPWSVVSAPAVGDGNLHGRLPIVTGKSSAARRLWILHRAGGCQPPPSTHAPTSETVPGTRSGSPNERGRCGALVSELKPRVCHPLTMFGPRALPIPRHVHPTIVRGGTPEGGAAPRNAPRALTPAAAADG